MGKNDTESACVKKYLDNTTLWTLLEQTSFLVGTQPL